MDANEAQLVAAINSFTNYKTVAEHENVCRRDMVPSCYVQIDVAHFMHISAKLLRK